MPDFKKSEDSLSSGNVTPIPTQGELGDISVEEPEPYILVSEPEILVSDDRRSPSRQTPLKSLLKKQSVDIEEFVDPHLLCVSDSEVNGRESPKKSVHFSEIDQVIFFVSVFEPNN